MPPWKISLVELQTARFQAAARALWRVLQVPYVFQKSDDPVYEYAVLISQVEKFYKS
jgi:hypothetical protein